MGSKTDPKSGIIARSPAGRAGRGRAAVHQSIAANCAVQVAYGANDVATAKLLS